MYVQDHLQGPATLLSIYLTGLRNVKNIGGETSISSLVGQKLVRTNVPTMENLLSSLLPAFKFTVV